MMKRAVVFVLAALLCCPAAALAEEAPAGEVLGTLEVLQGEVQVGQGDQWRAASPGQNLVDGDVVKTGDASAAEIVFEGGVKATVGENASVAVADLLLKARLEKMRNKISEPADSRKVEMQVTPTTGVRGTDQTEEKAKDLKREHYWNEKAE